ncbi:MAG TPA: alpha/beta hydrolase [Nitrososphaeraceae archaeon]|jgi:pimeloyl-ACP methyl ester carboxylesterase|nr:alpha/beta hydrolase [Nitrososphaeraceae archaeon]
MQLARINGEDLEYSTQGSSEGEPVILIHGGMFADMYVPLISQPILADNYHLVTYHRRGYPGSSHNALDNVSIQQQAADCKELMRILDINRAHVVGHSNAGLIVLQLAIDASDMVHSLSLLEPALVGFVPSGSQFAKRLVTVAGLLHEGKKLEALDFFLQTVFQGSPQYREIIDIQLPQGAFDLAVRDLDIIFRLEAPALQSWTFTVDDTKRIHQPVLYVGGEDSANYFQEIRTLVSTWFPHLKIIMIPNATHMLHMMSPKLVAEGLRDFFSRHPMH